MNIDNLKKAEILAEALPHIQKYRNKIIVVKYGGNAMVNEELKKAVMHDLVYLSIIGIKVSLLFLFTYFFMAKFIKSCGFIIFNSTFLIRLVSGPVNSVLKSFLQNIT